MKPWLIPIMDNIAKMYDKTSSVQRMLSEGTIEIVSLAHFRGRTFESAVCIVDEFQNLTVEQLAMCIGRLGKESLMIFCGDGDQIDLRNRLDSAFTKIESLNESPYVFTTLLKENYRHPAVKDVLERFYQN
jgi:phosphate starvation-inducible PhoH-like protein